MMDGIHTNGDGGSTAAAAATGGWVWLQGMESSRIDNPIPPLDEHDTRPAIKDLLEQYSEEIQAVRARLQDYPLYEPTKHDDLFLVRFLLSHNDKKNKKSKKKKKGHLNVDKALQSIQSTLDFRKEHHLDQYDIRNWNVNDWKILGALNDDDDKGGKPTTTHPYAKSLSIWLKCCSDNAALSYIPNIQRTVINIITMAGRDLHEMMKVMSEEEYFHASIIYTEWCHQWLDYITRTTGRLTKLLRVGDCENASIGMINQQAMKRDGHNSAVSEDKYPQLLGILLGVNAPPFIHMVFAMLKLFMPKRVLEKVNIVKPLSNPQHLQLFLRYANSKDLPTKYGGTLEGNWPPSKLLPTD